MAHIHREPYVTLAGLTDDSALIAWGAFFFEVTGQEIDGRFKIIEDRDLKVVNPPRETSIGESSNFYGPARVRVWEKGNESQAIEVEVPGNTPETRVNHTWARNLKPDTEYLYSVSVNDKPWADEERRDWVFMNGKQGMFLNKRQYENKFRTYPRVNQPTPDFTFAVIGDYGRGVRKPSTAENRQREIALVLEEAVQTKGVRFVLTTGGNVYHNKENAPEGGGLDSDWFFTYYQPYRYILNRVPFYPACGNHDTDETVGEGSDDYEELLDNFYIRERFLSGSKDEGEAVKEKGLFYVFRFGQSVELISIDSARQKKGSGPRAFQDPTNKTFIKKAIPQVQGAATVWRIPFFHHPPYVDGPSYDNFTEVIDDLVKPIFEKGGVRLVFNGHEHNLQISKNNNIHYVLTGSAGDLRPARLFGNVKAHNIAWAPVHHLILVEYKGGKMHVTPYGELKDGKLQPLKTVTDPQGNLFPFPLVVSLT